MGGDIRISPAFKKLGQKGTIKIKKSMLAGTRAGNSKSQQQLIRNAQGGIIEGSASAAALSSNAFPNNTQALAMGNLSNMQLL